MEQFAGQDPRSYSFYFDLNIWFRAHKVTGTFEKRAPGPSLANRKLKQRCQRQLQKRCLKLHRTYSISFNSSNVGKLFWCCILKDCIEVQGNKKKVVRHFHVVVMQRRQRNVQKSVMHVQSYCFIYRNFLLFCRFRCRRRRRCLSSLLCLY